MRVIETLMLLAILLVIVAIGFGVHRIIVIADECKKQHGVYFYSRESSVCLKGDVVIPLRGDTK